VINFKAAGSRSRRAIHMRIQLNPDPNPQHWFCPDKNADDLYNHCEKKNSLILTSSKMQTVSVPSGPKCGQSLFRQDQNADWRCSVRPKRRLCSGKTNMQTVSSPSWRPYEHWVLSLLNIRSLCSILFKNRRPSLSYLFCFVFEETVSILSF